MVTNTLTSLREDVKAALETNGLKAVEYVKETIVPPVCVVVPANPYITLPTESNPFRAPYSVGIHVLVIGGKGTNKTTATQIDSMLVDVIDALDDWDITEVTAPQEMSLKGIPYIGAVVTLETNTEITKEVI